MTQETVSTVYDRIEELRETFDIYLNEKDPAVDPETGNCTVIDESIETTVNELIAGIEALIAKMKN